MTVEVEQVSEGETQSVKPLNYGVQTNLKGICLLGMTWGEN